MPTYRKFLQVVRPCIAALLRQQMQRLCSGIAAALLAVPGLVLAQAEVPAEVGALVGTNFESGQAQLESMGYEIVYAQSKTQYWWSASQKNCISLSIKGDKFDKIGAIGNGECESRLDAAHKVYEGYADGQSDINGAQLDAARSQLAADGYKVSYWARNTDADKVNSIEYWYNESTKKCSFVVFRTADGNLIKKSDTDASMCKNPAPKN